MFKRKADLITPTEQNEARIWRTHIRSPNKFQFRSTTMRPEDCLETDYATMQRHVSTKQITYLATAYSAGSRTELKDRLLAASPMTYSPVLTEHSNIISWDTEHDQWIWHTLNTSYRKTLLLIISTHSINWMRLPCTDDRLKHFWVCCESVCFVSNVWSDIDGLSACVRLTPRTNTNNEAVHMYF